MEYFQWLPEEIVRKILLRVPFIFHNNLRYVSRNWKTMIESGILHEERERISLGISDKLVCLLGQFDGANRITIYDPVHNRVARSPSMPPNFRYAHYSQCLCVDKKLIVIGLEHERTPKKSTVMVYDFMTFRWRRGADIPIDTIGHRLAHCASPEGLVYVVTSCKAVAVYDVVQDKWDLLPVMPDSVVLPKAFYIDGMFYVVNISKKFSNLTHRFDPMIQRWQVLRRFELLRFPPLSCQVAFGRIYSFAKQEVMEFDCLTKGWFKVGRLPPYLDWLGSPQFEFRSKIWPQFLPHTPYPFLRRWVFTGGPKSTTWSYNTSLLFIEI
ncbi:hypothetical protein SUGI_0707480 [Cryptomeria japonica]|uniref:F-box/kelch-repeat protein At1g80440 n=1 Tax=Cryptomeria japonica TaxID=3369 RepID=UPI002414B870|nr:F-box/kelch-repeat protein At1g80440 [Cryptomeria japonica]GLJ35145.1 hypothetical protein SUGI_0707480 [Cryptomeria japonica]